MHSETFNAKVKLIDVSGCGKSKGNRELKRVK